MLSSMETPSLPTPPSLPSLPSLPTTPHTAMLRQAYTSLAAQGTSLTVQCRLGARICLNQDLLLFHSPHLRAVLASLPAGAAATLVAPDLSVASLLALESLLATGASREGKVREVGEAAALLGVAMEFGAGPAATRLPREVFEEVTRRVIKSEPAAEVAREGTPDTLSTHPVVETVIFDTSVYTFTEEAAANKPKEIRPSKPLQSSKSLETSQPPKPNSSQPAEEARPAQGTKRKAEEVLEARARRQMLEHALQNRTSSPQGARPTSQGVHPSPQGARRPRMEDGSPAPPAARSARLPAPVPAEGGPAPAPGALAPGAPAPSPLPAPARLASVSRTTQRPAITPTTTPKAPTNASLAPSTAHKAPTPAPQAPIPPTTAPESPALRQALSAPRPPTAPKPLTAPKPPTAPKPAVVQTQDSSRTLLGSGVTMKPFTSSIRPLPATPTAQATSVTPIAQATSARPLPTTTTSQATSATKPTTLPTTPLQAPSTPSAPATPSTPTTPSCNFGLECEVCHTKQKTLTQLHNHCSSHFHKQLEEKWSSLMEGMKCRLCGQLFKSRYTLTAHLGGKHGKINDILAERGYSVLPCPINGVNQEEMQKNLMSMKKERQAAEVEEPATAGSSWMEGRVGAREVGGQKVEQDQHAAALDQILAKYKTPGQ